jgi:hypothetical protein
MAKRKLDLSYHQRTNRQLQLTISMFLLNQEAMRGLVWTVQHVEYNRETQTIKVGIDTVKSKLLGTTLGKMRKLAKPLAHRLAEQGVTLRAANVEFYVHKQNEALQRIYSLLEAA